MTGRPQRRVFIGRGSLRLPRWLMVIALAAAAGAGMVNPPDTAHSSMTSSEDVEAAYLFNFGKFVRWPVSSPEGPLTICVAGEPGMMQSESRLVQGERIDGRPLKVKELLTSAGAENCSILFVGGAKQQLLDAYLSATKGKPVLTVGDATDFLARGGIIQFVLKGDHVRFAVSMDAARRNHLDLSSELLKVAIQVVGRPARGGK